MFTLNSSNTYKWPIEFTTLDENGKPIEQSFTAIYKRLPREETIDIIKPSDPGAAVTLDDLQLLRLMAVDGEIDDLIKEIDAMAEAMQAIKTGSEVIDNDVATIMRFMNGWEGVDIHGDASFNAENLTQLLNGVPNIHIVLIEEYFKSSVGGGQKTKNFKKPRATGRVAA